ncbi:hypothetical protein GCM10010324_27660 [Streptomyces hiroshimensis]|uniref:Uncharacterized protein n=1 Tax=Streptomyces hiroshimensis TaxID=66424 RepID=A0ABQ2YEL3_9ACTN|nr:hypothetical protein GCM10010324_27660 [Streptomyces hiroshimensis]
MPWCEWYGADPSERESAPLAPAPRRSYAAPGGPAPLCAARADAPGTCHRGRTGTCWRHPLDSGTDEQFPWHKGVLFQQRARQYTGGGGSGMHTSLGGLGRFP